jgi:hypothetical protein
MTRCSGLQKSSLEPVDAGVKDVWLERRLCKNLKSSYEAPCQADQSHSWETVVPESVLTDLPVQWLHNGSRNWRQHISLTPSLMAGKLSRPRLMDLFVTPKGKPEWKVK